MKPRERDGLSAARTVALLEAGNVEVDVEVETVDTALEATGTVAVEPEGSSVSWDAGATVPLTCRLVLAEQADWTVVRLRPVVTVTDGQETVRVPMGVFVPSQPSRTATGTPRRWDVDGYDLTSLLNLPHGQTFRIAEGDNPVIAARTLVEDAGLVASFTAVGDAKPMGRDRIWPLDPSTTTLDIVNRLLAEDGYQPVWEDGLGRIRSGPDRDPSDLPSEWVYDTTSSTTIVGVDRVWESDRTDLPNRLVAVSSNATAWDPVAGDGIVIVEDEDDIAARGRRNAMVTLDAVDQDELEAAAARKWAELTRASDTFRIVVVANPLHGHRDVVRLRDLQLGVDRRLSVTAWTLPLDGVSPMTVEGEGL